MSKRLKLFVWFITSLTHPTPIYIIEQWHAYLSPAALTALDKQQPNFSPSKATMSSSTLATAREHPKHKLLFQKPKVSS